MKKYILTTLCLAMSMMASALDLTPSLLDEVKKAKNVGCTVDFRHAIYNGADSASLAKSLGKEPGWEISYFNRLRHFLINGHGYYQSPNFCDVASKRKFNIHIVPTEVTANGGVKGTITLYNGNLQDGFTTVFQTREGKWNDFDILLGEMMQENVKSGSWYALTTDLKAMVDLQKDTENLRSKLSPKVDAHNKKKSDKATHDIDLGQSLALRSGSLECLNEPSMASIEMNIDDMWFETFANNKKLPAFKLVDYTSYSDILAQYYEMMFATEFNKVSKGLQFTNQPELSKYNVKITLTAVNIEVGMKVNVSISGIIEIFEIGSELPIAIIDITEYNKSILSSAYPAKAYGTALKDIAKFIATNNK